MRTVKRFDNKLNFSYANASEFRKILRLLASKRRYPSTPASSKLVITIFILNSIYSKLQAISYLGSPLAGRPTIRP